MVTVQTGKNGDEEALDPQEETPKLGFDLNLFDDEMSWWSGLADLDRLNILGSPLEDRARLLASKLSNSLDETMREIGQRTDFDYLDDFELPENPTKLLPLRLIHSFCCLPVEQKDDGKLELVTVWPPTQRMSRWVYAVSGQKPIWSLGSPEKISRAITENFGIGADSLDDSDLDSEEDEDAQDDLEDQNAAIIRFVNEVIQRAIVDRATDIHFEPHKDTLQIRYRIDGQLVPVRVPDNLRSFQDAIISRIKIMSGINISEKRRPQGGRITFSQGQSDLDIRVSTLPTLYGESISLRLLNEKSQPLSMQELGLLSMDERNIVSILEKPHGIVLVTGPTGSGKTTLLSMLLRLFDPDQGIVSIDGLDLREYEVDTLRKNIAIALQENVLFALSVKENIRYVAPNATDDEIHEAIRISCMTDYVDALPQGIDTELGDRGGRLSTGQRQRLSIARAVVRNTAILVLDEPTAALDAATEHEVMANLAEWGQGRAIFLITHRISTIRQADNILYLERGKILENGSHETLMQVEGGKYRSFVETESGLANRTLGGPEATS
mgnify:CR=1 FL=1